MKICIQARRKTNLSSRLGLSLKRLARRKGKSNRQKITREKRGRKWPWACSGVDPRIFIGGKPQRSKILNLTVKRSALRAFEIFQARPREPSPGKTFSFASILDPQVSLAQVCTKENASPSRGFCWGIQNQAFRILKIKE
jgi:hypothetical protein